MGQFRGQKASKRGQIGVKLDPFWDPKRAQKVGTPFGPGASRGIMTHFEEINGHFDPFWGQIGVKLGSQTSPKLTRILANLGVP